MLLPFLTLHGDVHRGREVLHQADLADPVDEGFAAENAGEELGRVDEALLRAGRLLAIFIIGFSQVAVREDLVGLADFLEFGVGGWVVRVLVWRGLLVSGDGKWRRGGERNEPGWWMMASLR